MAAQGQEGHGQTAGEYIVHHLHHLQTDTQKAVVDFSNSPLTISDDIVVGRPKQPKAQPAPNVPYRPAQ